MALTANPQAGRNHRASPIRTSQKAFLKAIQHNKRILWIWGKVDPLPILGRQNTVREISAALPPIFFISTDFYKHGLLGLIWGVFAWLRSFRRIHNDLRLEIVALR